MASNSESRAAIQPSRNQLATMAVLIVLIYLAVAAVVGLSPSLDVTQRWPLIVFLAVFPPLVLILCAWLVSRHHSKLYSSAMPDAEVSVKTLSPDQQRRKLNLELSTLNGNAGHVAGIDVRSAYLVAEDLVLRQMEIEHGTPFMRHVAIEGIPFDGAALRQDRIVGIEVKFVDEPRLAHEVIDTLRDKAEYAATRLKRSRPNASFTFLLALVTQMTPEEDTRFRMQLENRFAITPVKEIEIRSFNFDSLQTTFTSDGEPEPQLAARAASN
jgi:hypothetical protein